MDDIKVPVNNVCYKIQNLDFGIFLSMVNEYPKGQATFKTADFVVRPEKKKDSTQEWVLREDRDFGDDQWAIVNYGSSFFVDNSKDYPAITYFEPGGRLPDAARLTVKRDGDTDAVIIQTKSGILEATDGSNLRFANPNEYPPEDYNKILDRMKWKLIPKAPFLIRKGVYYFRTLNDLYLVRYPGTSAAVNSVNKSSLSSSSGDVYFSWVVKPAEGGKCTIQTAADAGKGTGYISCEIKGTPPTNASYSYLVNGPAFPWEIKSVGGIGYQFIMNDGTSKAITAFGTYTNISSNEVGIQLEQIWHLERDLVRSKDYIAKNPDT